MGSLVFLQSALLMGLAAAALPLAIHLIHRQKRQRIRFAAMRFLLQTDRRSARKYRLVDFLVLLLRMLLLALLALALAQPVWRPPGAADIEFGKLSVGLVVDDSMSMQRVTGGVRLFDRALEAARAIVAEIPRDSEAFVLFSSGRAPTALTVPASPPSSLSELLGDQECSHGGRPLAPAINEAVDILAGSKNRHRALVVIGDMQRRSIELADTLDAEKIEKEILTIRLLDLPGQRDNLSVEDATASPRVGFPGAPIRVRARLHNSGAAPAQARVSLWIDGQKVQDQQTDIEAGATGEVVFTRVLNETGPHHASVRLEPDALTGDNARYLTLHILPQISTLLITPSSSSSTRDESVFLRTALNPLRAPNLSGAAPVRVTLESYDSPRLATLERYGFIFVIDSGALPAALLDSLRQYAGQDGHVAFFPGLQFANEIALDQTLRDRSYAGHTLRGAWRRPDEEVSAAFGEIDRDHPIFSLLARGAPELFDAVAIHQYLDIDEDRLAPADRVVARFSDGAPLLIESAAGQGALYAWTFGCHPQWSDLPLRPLFLPLLYESLKRAGAGPGTLASDATVDRGFSLPVAPAQISRAARLTLPSGKENTLTIGRSQDTLDFLDATLPGIYQVQIIGEQDKAPIQIAVNVEPGECRLERADQETLAAWFPEKAAAKFEKSGAAIAQQLSFASQGYGLSGWLAGLALLALLCEIYLSNAFLRSESERPAWLRRLTAKLGRE